ncbi:hypothetical protein Taro_024474 [Colocasia esculenta]|uniref:Uncharacterized protein n=1 Tax=Colocasia esculenta TaxID=4460 RepID=A0A843V6F1_COLES|nr:hypothetical protein [Colocasia esculenta]
MYLWRWCRPRFLDRCLGCWAFRWCCRWGLGMDGFGGGGLGLSGTSSNPNGAGRDNNLFDASQYDFFGKDAMGEVELGGLEDDGDEDVGLIGIDGDDVHFSSLGEREEVGAKSVSWRMVWGKGEEVPRDEFVWWRLEMWRKQGKGKEWWVAVGGWLR